MVSTVANLREVSAASLRTGHRLKRANAVAAVLSGAFPGLLLARLFHPHAPAWIAGLLLGLLWANAFEYFYHRYLLHYPKSSFGKGHLLHHWTTGTPQEPEHVTFGSSPLWVTMLFVTNGMVALVADLLTHTVFTPGILTGFSAYMVAVEEIHWRIHLGGWLPPGLAWTREYHLAHHDIPSGRFNVFFPIFDFVFGNMRPPLEQTQAAQMAAAVPAADALACWSTLKYTMLSLWIMAIAIGVRYVWSAKTRI